MIAPNQTLEDPQRQLDSHEPEVVRPPAPRARVTLLAVIALLIVCALGVLFVMGYLPHAKQRAALVADSARAAGAIQRVTVVRPRLAPSTHDVSLPGTIEARQETTIYARSSGYLKKWHVDIGDHVSEGQLLAEIETPELDQEVSQAIATNAQLAAKLQSAKARAVLGDSTYAIYEGFGGNGAVSKQDVAEKLAARDTARAAIDVANADIAAGEASLRRLQQLKSFARVIAPFAGTITQRNVDVGGLVTAGTTSSQALFRLADSKSVRVFVDVPQAVAPGVRSGTPADLLIREYPGRAFAGKISRTSGAVDPRSRTLRTEIEVPNDDGTLIPGMFARVRLALKREKPALIIPASALVVTAEGTQVAVVSDDDRVRFKKIEIVSDTGTELAIASGLTDDDRVVANPSQRLLDGDKVEVAAAERPKGT